MAGGRLAERLVNTFDVLRSVERLGDLDALTLFLARAGIEAAARPSGRDLTWVVQVRGRLRSAFTDPDEDRVVETLNDVLADSGAVPRLARHDGRWRLHVTPPHLPPVRQLSAVAAMGLLGVVARHGLDRFHTCARTDCEAVFVDASRNGSRRYCTAATCANRAHAATYRARHRT